MAISSLLSAALILGGLFFFLAGTVGVLRFPDVFTRLHALTKADNCGLGLIIAGLAIQSDSWGTLVRLLLTWVLVLAASATVCFLIARTALRHGQQPWTRS